MGVRRMGGWVWRGWVGGCEEDGWVGVRRMGGWVWRRWVGGCGEDE